MNWIARQQTFFIFLIVAVFISYGCVEKSDITDNSGDYLVAKGHLDEQGPGSPKGDYGEYYKTYCPDNSDPENYEDTELNYDQEIQDDVKVASGFVPGDIEAVHFKNDHPFHLRQIKIYFKGSGGPVMIRVHADHCRSWPDVDSDLTDPIYKLIPEDAGWVTIDLPEPGIFILPNERFWIAYWHYYKKPYLGQDDSESNLRSRSRFYSKSWAESNYPFVWGVAQNNYMIRAVGSYFCHVENPYFTEVSENAGLAYDDLHYQRVNWADVNGDTYDDVLFTMDGQDNSYGLYVNNQDGTFTDTTDSAGLNNNYQGDLALFGDVDNDGDPDLFVGVYVAYDPYTGLPEPGARSTLLINDGSGVFTEFATSGLDANEGTLSAAAFADFNDDGNLDLYMGNWLKQYPYNPSYDDWLFMGNGDGTFTDVSDASGILAEGARPCYGVTWSDYDNDGDQDIFVANYGRVKNLHFQNQGDGTFIHVGKTTKLDSPSGSPGNTFGADFGDLNNDGYLDAYLVEISHPRYQPSSEPSSLNMNQGPPDYIYTNVIEDAGIACDEGEIDPSFIDWDNDGLLDIFVSDLYTDHYCRLFHQEDDGTFTDVTYLAGIDVHDCTNNAWADFDKDGDLDLMTTQRASGYHVRLYKNEVGQDNNWVTIRVTGTSGTVNAEAVGSRVTVVTSTLTQIREVQAGKGHHASQPSLPVEFGLGDISTIDQVTVLWAGGTEQTWTGVDINKFVHLIEGDGTVYYDN